MSELSPMAAALELLEGMAPVIAAVAGYRQECIAQGFNETAAEQMAVEFHGFVLAQALKGMP